MAKQFDVVVIGAGPGGYVAAWPRGHEATWPRGLEDATAADYQRIFPREKASTLFCLPKLFLLDQD